MNLEEAIKKLERFDCTNCPFVACEQCEINNSDVIAINTVLKELEILKKENDTLWEENIKLKQLNIAYKLRINDFAIDIHKAHAEGYQDGFKQAKFDCEMDKLDGR